MREKKIFVFHSTDDSDMHIYNRELLETKISQLASRMTDEGTFYDGWVFSVYSDTLDYELIWQEAEKLGLKAEVGAFKMEYTKEDFEKAEFFMISISIFGKEDYTYSYATKYIEESKCEKCGKSLLRQNSELYIDKTLFRGRDIGITSNDEMVVSEKLRKIIEESSLSGIEFATVKHKNLKIKNDFNVYQMVINTFMPNMDKSTSVRHDNMGYCDFCKTHGVLLTSLPKYIREDIKCIKDFNLSKEYFGGGYSGYHNIIITKKAYNVFAKNKIQRCKFDIVLTI